MSRIKILNKLLDIEVSSKDIINFIFSEINKDGEKTYLEAKRILKEKYSAKSKEQLEEDYEVYRYKKIALESMSPENLTVGSIAIYAIIITLYTTIAYKGIIDFSILISTLVFIFLMVLLMFLLQYRIRDKSKKMAYYSMIIEVVEEILKKYKEVEQVEENC